MICTVGVLFAHMYFLLCIFPKSKTVTALNPINATSAYMCFQDKRKIKKKGGGDTCLQNSFHNPYYIEFTQLLRTVMYTTVLV